MSAPLLAWRQPRKTALTWLDWMREASAPVVALPPWAGWAWGWDAVLDCLGDMVVWWLL
jgi:hypothetical protein